MERTKLANERTLLSYTRTAIALVLAGLTFIKLFRRSHLYRHRRACHSPWPGGYYRFAKRQKAVSQHTIAYTPTSPMLAEVAAREKKDSSAQT